MIDKTILPQGPFGVLKFLITLNEHNQQMDFVDCYFKSARKFEHECISMKTEQTPSANGYYEKLQSSC